MLAHPNIIALKAVCLEEPNLCLVMEYAAGGPQPCPGWPACAPWQSLSTGPCKLPAGCTTLHCEALVPVIHRDLSSPTTVSFGGAWLEGGMASERIPTASLHS